MRRGVWAAVLVVLAATPAAGWVDDNDDPFYELREIPKGQTLYARADSIAALRKATAPAASFTVPHGGYDETFFLWTGKTADNTRYFSLATVYPFQAPAFKGYGIFNPSKSESYVYGRITAEAAKGDPARPVLAKREEQALWATVASVHPQYGTLYQLSLDRPHGEFIAHNERRVFIMHDPAHGWRFVGQVEATYIDESVCSYYREERKIERQSIAWTGDPDAPVRIVCTMAAKAGYVAPAPDVATFPLTGLEGEVTYGGPLPVKRVSARYWTTIRKGQTLSGLARVYGQWSAGQNGFGDTGTISMREAIVALNPGVERKGLRAGERLALPDMYSPLAKRRK